MFINNLIPEYLNTPGVKHTPGGLRYSRSINDIAFEPENFRNLSNIS